MLKMAFATVLLPLPLALTLSYIHSLHISSFRTLFLMRYIVSQAEVVEEQMKSTFVHPLLNME